MSGKCKSSSPSTIPVKNRRKTINTEEKREVISRFEKGERIVDICHNVRIAHNSARDILMLIELKEVLSQKLKCLYSKTTTVLSEWTVPKTVDVPYIFIALEKSRKYFIEMYIYSIYSRCILHRSVCPLVVKLYAIYEGFSFEKLRKYSELNGNFFLSLSLHRALRRVTWSAHHPMHTLKLFTLKLLKMLRQVSIIRSSSGSCLFLAKIALLKIFTAWFSYNNLVMWQQVVLCRSSVARSAPDRVCRVLWHTRSGALGFQSDASVYSQRFY